MLKDFDRWNEQKKRVDAQESGRLYRAREVWWCKLGINVGFEQDGTGVEHSRPVLVLKAFSAFVCLIVPLSTSTKKKYCTYFEKVFIGMTANLLILVFHQNKFVLFLVFSIKKNGRQHPPSPVPFKSLFASLLTPSQTSSPSPPSPPSPPAPNTIPPENPPR